MEFVIEQHIRAFGEKRPKGAYSESTIKNYVSAVRSLHKHVNGNAVFDDLEWSRNQQHVLDVVAKLPNLQTRRNLINGLIASLQTMNYPMTVIHPYEGARDLYNAQYMADGWATENQLKIMNAVSRQDILDFLSKEGLDPTLTQNMTRFSSFVILSIHTYYPFRNELGDMKLIRRVIFDQLVESEKKKNNWVVLDKGFDQMTFAITHRNNEKKHGFSEIQVKPQFTKFILKMCQIRELKLADINFVPLFITSRKDPFNKNKVSKHLADYTTKGLGHPIGTTILSKMFGTTIVDLANPTVEELAHLKDEADIRCHSLSTKFTKYVDVLG